MVTRAEIVAARCISESRPSEVNATDHGMPANAPERTLLREIDELSGRVRKLRETGVVHDGNAIKALEAQARAKWDELRALRAGSMNEAPPKPRYGGHYR
jgi:hypothetical protein